MSGGPPHHPHSRQAPSPNTAWNHLQVPNYYPRQPQHAHMSNEHPLLHQSTWHTPTTEPVKSISHSHLFNLEQMITERQYSRHSPGVDLTLQRNGNQNGELPATPISLSVRDANKINSLPASAIDMQAVELTKSSSPGMKTGLKATSPILKSLSNASTGINIKATTGSAISTTSVIHEKQESSKTLKRPMKRMDSIIERLNPIVDKNDKLVIAEKLNTPHPAHEIVEKSMASTVIVQPTSTVGCPDENSNSSSINIPKSTNATDEDVISPYSNEDSTDSNKSRRRRKPAKTIRVSKEIEKQISVIDSSKMIESETHPESIVHKIETERRRSGSVPPKSPTLLPRTRRKTSSESETIANISAMIQKTAVDKTNCSLNSNQESKADSESQTTKPISVSVIKTTEESGSKKQTNTNSFVEVENKLEQMFAGISDYVVEPPQIEKGINYDDSKTLDLEESKSFNTSTHLTNDSVTSTSSDINSVKSIRIKSAKSLQQHSIETISYDISPKRKKGNKKSKFRLEGSIGKIKINSKKRREGSSLIHKQGIIKTDLMKEIYNYDSGSNASSNKSRGPFVQIRGSRESPLSVNIINTPINDEDIDRKGTKLKKYHDDTEYRHKVKSRGLHCSTLSNKYDAQTRDATWICVFCKRGPHATDPHISGPSKFNATISMPPPGDLFGPYIITTDSPEYQRRLDDPYDQQFKSKKVARAVNAISINKNLFKKSKRKHSDSFDNHNSLDGIDNTDIYLGITETKDKVYEVWVHEDCLVWSPGVFLIGPKIIGLEEAVWTSCNVVCIECRFRGANLCCVKRGCMNVMHLGCAAAADWYLDEENYKAVCVSHKTP